MENEELATIKKPGEVETVSREEFEKRIKLIARCKRDINFWAENFFRIISLDTGLQVIKLYDKQKELLKALVDNDRTIVLSARQTGKCLHKSVWITIRHKKFPLLQIPIPIGIFYKIAKFFKK